MTLSNDSLTARPRFSQIRPKIIFSVEAVSYNMKTHDHLGKLGEVVDKLDSVKCVVVLPAIHSQSDIDITNIPHAVFLDSFIKTGRREDGTFPPLAFEQVSL